jgi:hypothetical protein
MNEGTTEAADSAERADDSAAGADDSGKGGWPWFQLPSISLSVGISLTALTISIASFYLTRVRPADIGVVPGQAIVMWWNGIGGGTEFQWINSHFRLPLVFANNGAQRSVIREVRLHTKGANGTLTWPASDQGSDGNALAIPFQIDGGGTALRTLDFSQSGREHQVLRQGEYDAELEVRTDLSFDWQPLIRFRFKIDRAPSTQIFGQRFSYPISELRQAD